MLLALTTVRGKRLGAGSEVWARILDTGEEEVAEKAMELFGRRYKTTPLVNLLTRNEERAILKVMPAAR